MNCAMGHGVDDHPQNKMMRAAEDPPLVAATCHHGAVRTGKLWPYHRFARLSNTTGAGVVPLSSLGGCRMNRSWSLQPVRSAGRGVRPPGPVLLRRARLGPAEPV